MAFLRILLLSYICCGFSLTAELEHMRELTDTDFKKFIGSPNVRVVYFYDNKLSEEDDDPFKILLPALKTSCEALDSTYNVQCAKVDCDLYPIYDFCARPEVKQFIYTFRHGKELSKLALDGMFDFDSMISNILQNVLQEEVPIFNTLGDLRNLEQINVGKQDVVCSRITSTGSYEHRIVMELAYLFKHQFQFALTTNDESVKDLLGHKPYEDVELWVLHCKEAKTDKKPCSVTKYRDNIDLLSFGRFLHNIDMAPVLTIPDSNHTLYEENGMHMVAFIANSDRVDDLKMEIQYFIPKYRGLIGFLIVDKSKVDMTKFGVKHKADMSMVTLKLRDETEWEMMPLADMPVRFINRKLRSTVVPRRRTNAKMTDNEDEPDRVYDDDDDDDYEEDYKDARLEEDDEVAKAVNVIHGRSLDHTHVQRLTEETFTAQTQSTETLVVMFYLVFDVRSKASLLSFLEASRLLAADSLFPLATVECHDERDLCASQNITSFPIIRVFRKGKKSFNYNGVRGAKEIYSFVKVFLADAPVHLNTLEELILFREKNFTSVQGMFAKNNDTERKAFRSAAKKMQGQMLFVEMTVQLDDTKFMSQLPKVYVDKPNDEFRPEQNCLSTDSDMIVKCALDAARFVFPELTANSFPKMYEESILFLILFTHGRDNDIYRTVGALAADVNAPKVKYCWMDLDAKDGIAMHVLMKYRDNETSTPSLNLVDYQRGGVYHYNKTSYEQAVLVPWIEAVLRDEVSPSMTLSVGEWKPLMTGYDFLTMIDEENGDFTRAFPDEDISGANQNYVAYPEMKAEAEKAIEQDERLHYATTSGLSPELNPEQYDDSQVDTTERVVHEHPEL